MSQVEKMQAIRKRERLELLQNTASLMEDIDQVLEGYAEVDTEYIQSRLDFPRSPPTEATAV